MKENIAMHFVHANLTNCKHINCNKFKKIFCKSNSLSSKEYLKIKAKGLYSGMLYCAVVFNQLWLSLKEKPHFTLNAILQASEPLILAWVEEWSRQELFPFWRLTCKNFLSFCHIEKRESFSSLFSSRKKMSLKTTIWRIPAARRKQADQSVKTMYKSKRMLKPHFLLPLAGN